MYSISLMNRIIRLFKAKNYILEVNLLNEVNMKIPPKLNTIKDFILTDEQATLAFCRNIFFEKRWPLKFMDPCISKSFNRPRDVFLVVKLGITLIGCGGLKELSTYNALLTRFYITKLYRGTGLATKLYNRLLDRARKLKYNYVVLDVARDNIEALRFYEKQGIEQFNPTCHSRWPESAPKERKYSRYFRKRL